MNVMEMGELPESGKGKVLSHPPFDQEPAPALWGAGSAEDPAAAGARKGVRQDVWGPAQSIQ